MIKNGIFSLVILFLISCASSERLAYREAKSKVDKKYHARQKGFYGKLSSSEYRQLLQQFEKELDVKLTPGKGVLINFYDNGANCVLSKIDYMYGTINRGIQISGDLGEMYNYEDYFVYGQDAIHKYWVQEHKKFIPDTGLFKDIVFSDNDSCEGFMAIKPNGEYLKYYGVDYYSLVRDFFEGDELPQ